MRPPPVITTAPWTRGPFLLLRQPMAMFALAAASSILGLAASTGPLFISSVGTGALHVAAEKRCVQDDQISVINPALNVYLPVAADPQAGASVQAADPVVRAAFNRANLPEPDLTTYTTVATTDDSGRFPTDVGLFSNDDALAHVEVLSRVPGGGIFITNTYAAQLGIGAGDQLLLAATAIPIAGVYRDLDDAGFRTVLPDFWCHWRSLIVTSVSSQPPPFVLADAATVYELGGDVEAEWTSPVDIAGLTLAEARTVATTARSFFPANAVRQTNTSSVVAGFGIRTTLDFDVQETEKLQAAVGSPVAAIATAGAILSLVLVSGSVVFWTQRRQRELLLLSTRGVGPFALGLKAVSELALPAAVGCAVGWGLGLLAIPIVAPSPLLEPGAAPRALLAAGAGWLACVVCIVLMTMAITGEWRRRPGLATFNFRLALFAAAPIGVALWLFQKADLQQVTRPGVYLIDPALLLSPVLALSGLVLAAAMLATTPLARVRSRAGGSGFALFAAVNRSAAARGPIVAVICGLAIPIGLSVYSAGFTQSSETTIEQKAANYTGAPVVLDVRVQLGGHPDVGTLATPVSYTLAQTITRDGDASQEIEILGIDPNTFARYALADPEVTGTPLPNLLRALTDRPPGQPTPALLVAAADTAPPPTAVDVRSSTLSFEVVERVPAFPGMRYPSRPMLVVDLAAISDLDRFGGWHNELWTDQQHVAEVLSRLSAQGIIADDIQDPATFLDATSLLRVTWTFDFLRVVSTLIGVVSLAGLFLFLSARQRRQAAAYVLLKRMGMSPLTYLRSLLLELTALSAWSWLTGCLTGALALLVATNTIDVNPGFAPPTLLRLPVDVILITGAALLVAVFALSYWTQRRAEQADPASILRFS